jgi:hypothetical protein
MSNGTVSTTSARVPLYQRLPEIYRQRDIDQSPPGQLQAYLSIVENVLGAMYDNIGELYRDLFIETCDAWVIPYIGDLLGVSPLSGDAWTLRADVADAIALRRRKGTLHALELLAYDLTKWASFCLELRDTLAWHQHLNHQRPDVQSTVQQMEGVARGGTAEIRDPALLSLIGTPFDPFAYYADFKPVELGVLRRNLPYVAVFLWRLLACQAGPSMPVWRGTTATGAVAPLAAQAVRFDMEPSGKPAVFFNISQLTPSPDAPMVSTIDQMPGPIPMARLTQETPAGAPEDYVSVNTYDAAHVPPAVITDTSLALQFHLPQAIFPADTWTFRGANLCGWEAPLDPPLNNREVVIDPRIGRAVFGVATAPEAGALQSAMLITWTYGAPGPVGAQPVADLISPVSWLGDTFQTITVRYRENPLALQHALGNLNLATGPVLIEIDDSMTHTLDISTVAGVNLADPIPSLELQFPLLIRATAENRPLVKLLHHSLAFRPVSVVAGVGQTQPQVDAQVASLKVLFEGIYINGDGLPAGTPLVARAAIPALQFARCTLDPGGVVKPNGMRSAMVPALGLDARFGFASNAEYDAFLPDPKITLYRSIAGPIEMESVYQLQIQDSIVDGGAGPGENAAAAIAIGSQADPLGGWGPVLSLKGITVFGRARVRSANGSGGIWCHALEAQDNQTGCLRFCWFAPESNRLPQNFGCVTGVPLQFTATTFGEAGYGQIALDSDVAVREKGPGNDEMGAFGFLLNSHKWRNLQIRFREFMPAGIKPVIVPVT